MDCLLVATALVMLHIKAGFNGMIKFLTNYTTPLQVFDSDISGFWNNSFLCWISVGACHSFILHIYLKNWELLYYFSLSLSLSSSPQPLINLPLSSPTTFVHQLSRQTPFFPSLNYDAIKGRPIGTQPPDFQKFYPQL